MMKIQIKKWIVEEEADDEEIVVEMEMDIVVEFLFGGSENFDLVEKGSDEIEEVKKIYVKKK